MTLLPTATTTETRQAVLAAVGERRGLAALTAAVLIVGTLSGLAVPALLGRIIDAAIDGDGRGTVDKLALAILGALLLRAVLQTIGAVLVARLGEEMLADLRERVVDRALRIPQQVLERAGTGDLLSRVSGDVDVVSTASRVALPVLVISTLDVGLTIVGLAALDWRLALAGLAPVPVWIISTRWYLRKSGPVYARSRIAEGKVAQALFTSITGARTVRAFLLGTGHLGRIEERSHESIRLDLAATRMTGRFVSRLNFAELVGVVSILTVGFLLVRDDAVTVGAATAAALYFLRLFDPMGALLFTLDEAQSAGAALARLYGVTQLEPPPRPEHRRTAADGGVEIEDLHYSYRPGHEVLSGIDLRIEPGERIALVGPSGAGKTTLAALLAGVHHPDRGTVRVGGVPVAHLADHQLGLVSQEVRVFAGTLADDLRLARPSATDDELRSALRLVGALDWAEALPDGLATRVGEGGHPLSATHAGQLALARLVLTDPVVAILDEATAEAGSAGARELERSADAALRGRTAVVIAHRLTQASSADRIVVLHEGRIVESGTHDDLVASGGTYATLWSAWSVAR